MIERCAIGIAGRSKHALIVEVAHSPRSPATCTFIGRGTFFCKTLFFWRTVLLLLENSFTDVSENLGEYAK